MLVLTASAYWMKMQALLRPTDLERLALADRLQKMVRSLSGMTLPLVAGV
jgi:hypothetical protein